MSSGGERFVDMPSVAAQPARPRRDSAATAAMVLGIVAIATAWMPYVFVAGAICAVLALAFGAVALRRHRSDSRGFAVTGVITGGAAVVLTVLGVVTTRVVADAIDRFENPPPSDVNITRCTIGDRSIAVEGTIENLGSRTSDYRITLRIPGGRSLELRRVVIEVDDVAAGATDEFRATYRVDDVGAEPTCAVVDVTGPLPFGVDPGR